AITTKREGKSIGTYLQRMSLHGEKSHTVSFTLKMTYQYKMHTLNGKNIVFDKSNNAWGTYKYEISENPAKYLQEDSILV
ncbi:hypothetical protein PENTCL1PPCAC_12048, partial [Pristionchus entomophagus]